MRTIATQISPEISDTTIPLYTKKDSHVYHEWCVYNNTSQDIYICDVGGEVCTIDRALGMHALKGEVVITYRTTKGTDRVFDKYDKESHRNGSFKIGTYRIAEKDFVNHEAFYLRTLGFTLAQSKEGAIAAHPLRESYIEEKVKSALNSIVDSIHDAPIRCEVNDPSGAIKKLFLSFGGPTLSVTVKHDKVRESSCVFYFRNKYGTSDKVTFELLDILHDPKPHTIGDWEIFVGPTSDSVDAWKLSSDLKKQKQFTREELEKYNSVQTEELKKKCDYLRDENTQLKTRLKESEAACRSYSDRVALADKERMETANRLHELTQFEYGTKSDQVKHATEQIKLRKEEVSAASSEVAAIGTVAKAALVAVPALLAAVIAMKATSSKLAIVGTFSVAKFVVTGVCAGIAAACGAFFRSFF